jgi:Protein of unknown function (DUF3326)
MRISDKSLKISLPNHTESLLAQLGAAVKTELGAEAAPVRFVVTETDERVYHCEVAAVSQFDYHPLLPPSIFHFRARQYTNNSQFNVVLLIPTGIDCEIGGHAGDATPVARLLAALCDHLIIHPNVVNASDINELTENCIVVEGSTLARLLMGTVGLQPVRANRVLVILEEVANTTITEAAINSVAAARATLGIHCTGIVRLKKPCTTTIEFTDSGRASGTITDMETLMAVLMERRASYDAVATVTVLGTQSGQERLMHDYYVLNTTNPRYRSHVQPYPFAVAR